MGCLRGISGRKTEEMAGEWRKVHDKELNDLYSLHQVLFG